MMNNLAVEVVYSPKPGEVKCQMLDLPMGSLVKDALNAVPDLHQWLNDMGSGKSHHLRLMPWVGIWGKRAPLDAELMDGDRVECYRALTVDPKVARRERFKLQGARSAGLFSKKRPGAKAGY